MAKTLRVGMIGYGFMGKAHSNAWRQAPHFFPLKAEIEMHTICGRNAEALEQARVKYGWKNACTDWRQVVNSPEIDIIDIATSNLTHAEIGIAAAKAGKHIFCEKPLAMNLVEAKKMLEAARKSGVKNMVGFNYRRVPAIAFARKLIDSGKLGQIRHFRGTYLQSWVADPKFPMNWRMRKETAGSGAHGDLNAHLIDLAHYLVGDIAETIGLQETFIKERQRESQAIGLGASAGKGTEKVTVDDASVFLAKFAGGKNIAPGAYGTFEATRLAPGHKNYNRFEINGSEGSLIFCFERMNELEYCNRTDPPDQPGFKTIMCTEKVHPYMEGWWPPGHVLGYEHTFVHEVVDLVNAIADGSPLQPDFLAGAKCVAVLESAVKSTQGGRWTKVAEVK
ncbi:MAG TPA: Gfo/Idh/MocA family oxidoreductase [Candidatus Saccharimonadales bacterium]|nr:Gfo/Idh/MocA family oxidoreductase [Candidatus Saccharimonadales bacterium]